MQYTRTNAFVRGLADGTLPWESYAFFLQQDYVRATGEARAHSADLPEALRAVGRKADAARADCCSVFALEAYKSDSFADIAAATEIVSHIVREAKLHIDVR